MNKETLEFIADQQRKICEHERMLESIYMFLTIDQYQELDFIGNDMHNGICQEIRKLKNTPDKV